VIMAKNETQSGQKSSWTFAPTRLSAFNPTKQSVAATPRVQVYAQAKMIQTPYFPIARLLACMMVWNKRGTGISISIPGADTPTHGISKAPSSLRVARMVNMKNDQSSVTQSM
jgi:hypothetical protein